MRTETLPPAPHAAPHDATAPDQSPVNTRKVILVGAVSVFVFVLGSLWSLRIQSATQQRLNPNGPALMPATLRDEEHGIVDAVPFALNGWVPKNREAASAQLTGYAWLDRKAGVVRLPIERAMQLVVADQRRWTQGPTAPAPGALAPLPQPKKPEPKKPGAKNSEGSK